MELAAGELAGEQACAGPAHRRRPPRPLTACRRRARMPSSPCSTEIGSDEVIPVPNVNSKILAKVIEYCTFHVAAEKKASWFVGRAAVAAGRRRP